MTDLPFEFAKALKDAGWPQPEGVMSNELDGGSWVFGPIRGEVAYSPTLEELIEKCPEEVGGGTLVLRMSRPAVAHYEGSWTAPEAEGDTVKEAVASLYLALKAAGKT